MSGEGKLFSNTVLLGISSALSKAISFLMLPLYTAALTPAQFGVADVLVSTAVLLLPLVSLHAPQAVFRFRAGGARGAISVGELFLAIGIGLFALCLPLVALSGQLRPYLWLLFAYVVASVGRSFLAHILRSDGAFLLYAIQQLFCTVLGAVLQILFLVTLGWGIRGYLLAVILGDTITFLVLFATQPRRFLPDGAIDRGLCRSMAKYALPLIPGAVLWWIISMSDRYLLLLFGTETDTGVYAAAGRLPGLITLAVSVFLEAWHYAALRTEREGQGALFSRIYALLLPGLLLFCSVLCVTAQPLVSLLLAPGYARAATLVPLLVFGALCAALSNFLGSVYHLRLRSGASLWTSLAATGINVLLNFALIPRLFALGAAISTAISYAFLFALRLWHAGRYLSFSRFAAKSALSLLTLFAGGVCFALERGALGTVLCYACLVPIAPMLYASLHFFARRAVLIWKKMKKKREIR